MYKQKYQTSLYIQIEEGNTTWKKIKQEIISPMERREAMR